MQRHQRTGPRPSLATIKALSTPASAANAPLHTSVSSKWLGALGAIWGLGGTILLLLSAIVHALGLSSMALFYGLSGLHWLALAGAVVIIAYTAGCRALQRLWVPRVTDRTLYLQWHWTPLRLILAPLYCMSLFHASAKSLFFGWATIASVALLMIALHQLAQPWSGIIASGVLAGLAWGLAALLLQSVMIFLAQPR